jgi:hypothetical protein
MGTDFSRMENVNVTGRRPGGSELIALDIDEPSQDGLYNLRSIKPIGHYKGATGNADLDLLGFDAQILDDNTIRLYLINQRPPVDASDNIVDASKSGANSTVEIFEMRKGQEQMRHVRTVSSDEVWTPNRVAALDDGSGGFLVTNDHSVKVGMVRNARRPIKCRLANLTQRLKLDYFIGGGNVAYCDGAGTCHPAYDGREDSEATLKNSLDEPIYRKYLNQALIYLPKSKLKFPNGLARGRDGLFYVPSTVDGQIRVLALQPDKTLRLIDTIHVGMPLDNISPDANGDMYVAGFPNLLQSVKGLGDPYNEISPATIWRIRKTVDAGKGGVKSVDYRVEKVIEDREGKVLSGSTTVRHDVKTGRLFVSGKSMVMVLFEKIMLICNSCSATVPCRVRTYEVSTDAESAYTRLERSWQNACHAGDTGKFTITTRGILDHVRLMSPVQCSICAGAPVTKLYVRCCIVHIRSSRTSFGQAAVKISKACKRVK